MQLFKYEPRNGLNFGDELGPYIVNILLQRFRLKISEEKSHKRLFSVGSVIHLTGTDDVVWGSGINGKVPLPIHNISRNYRAIRGPLSRKILSQNSIYCPRIYGDPAILLPSIYVPKRRTHTEGKILVVPNYNDFELVKIDMLRYENVPNIMLQHPFLPPLFMIDLIANAKAVITSSLHAKIIADCYKIPNAVLGGEGYSEHSFKYMDYVQGVGYEQLEFFGDIASGIKHIENPLTIKSEITANLLDSFPKDLFDAN